MALFEEYDDLVKNAGKLANPQLRGSLYAAADVNPDEEAGLHQLAKKTKLPVESLRADRGAEARRRVVAEESEKLPPATSSFLADPENAQLAHDDADKLAALERVARTGFGAKGPVSTLAFAGKGDQAAAEKAREYVGAVLGGFKSSVPSFNAGLAETGRIVTEATGYGTALRSLSDLTSNETFRNIAEAPRLAELYWESLAEEARVKVKARSLPDYLQQASGSLGVSLMAAPFGVAGQGPALGIFGISAPGGQEELTGAGFTEQQAAAVSIPKKIMEGLTEKLGLDALYKGGKPLLKAMTGFVFKDLAGEELNTVYTAIADKVTIRPDMTWNDLGQSVVDTAIVTGLMGGAQGAAFHGSAQVADYLQGEFEQSRRTRAAVNLMESLGEATKNSKTFQRMPEKLRDIISRVTAEGPVENVYVPAESIRQLFQGKAAESDTEIASMLDDPESYYQALAVGGDVVIPLPEYVEKWAGSEYHQALVKDIRLHAGDMSQRELEEWGGRMPEEFGTVLKDLDEEEKTVAGDKKVRDEILGQLLGVGRDRTTAEREALLWQSRYRSRAERLGRDAWELYQENPVRIKRPVPEFMTRRDFIDTSIDPFLDRLRSGDVPTEAEAMGTSLVEFLREKGLQDEGGDLASMGVNDGLKPFQKRLSREDGLPLDKAREAAAEAGYLPTDSTIADFLVLIDQELRGAPVYSTAAGNEGAASLRLEMEQLKQYLEGEGVDVSAMSNEEIRKALKGAEFNQGAVSETLSDVIARLQERFPEMKLDAFESRGVISINRIVFPKDQRGKGQGSEVFKAITEYADATGQIVAATPSTDFGGTKSRIVAFNKRFGFVENKGKNKDFTISETMYRLPKEPRSLNQSAWHGSPYTFDKFSLGKIGTGEGAQAYGYGLYFAGAKEVAEFYRDSLSSGELKLADGTEYDPKNPEHFAAATLLEYQSPEEAITDLQRRVEQDKQIKAEWAKDSVRQKQETIKLIKRGNLPELKEESSGRVYAVELAPKEDEYLLWDKPLNEQSEMVKEVLDRLGEEYGFGVEEIADEDPNFTGRDFYRYLETEMAVQSLNLGRTADAAASELLLDMGIRGIKYLDGTSRGKLQHVPITAERREEVVARLNEIDTVEIPAVTDGAVYKRLNEERDRLSMELAQADAPPQNFNYVIFSDDDVQIKEMFQTFAEGKRGSITFRPGFRDIALLEKADLSTFLHESGHAWLEELREDGQTEGAPDQVRQDWETVAAWAGIASDASTIDVEAHEKFARAVEAYLMEGQAPSAELQPAFQRFQAWLVRIYRELRNLNVNLTDEVRRVLDRLLATDEEIKRAEDLQSFHPLFTDAAAAGMTEREFEAYRKEVERAHTEASTRLKQQLMREITREQKAWWKEEREKVLGEVMEEAQADPVYIALQVLTTGKDFQGNEAEEGFKLSKADLVRMYGKEFVKKLPRSFSYTYAKEGGVHPDAAAEVFGFSSGDEMVRKMANTPPLKKFVEAETDLRMRQVYGDMLNDGTLADEALKALHSDYQGQVLRAELRALRRKQREVSPFVKAEKNKGDEALRREKEEREYERRWMDAEKKLALELERGAAAEEIRKLREEVRVNKEAARRARMEMEAGIPPLDSFKMWAAQTIGAKSIASIHPAVYARAEQKAGKAAFEAASKGKFDKAGEEKQKQLLNHYLYLEAVKAKEDSEKIYDYAKRLEKPAAQSRIGKAGGEYLEQINSILERYEFKKATLEGLAKRQSLLEWAQQQEALGLEPSIPEEMLDELRRKNYKELTIDELRAVRDALKNIEHLSREANRIRIDNEEIELDLAISELSAAATRNFDPKRIPLDRETVSWLDKQKDRLSSFDASLIKAEQLIEWMDGGAINGPWARMIFRPIAAAESREHDLTLSFTTKLANIFEAFGKAKRKTLMEKVFIASIGESITKQAAISAALNSGNDSNRKKLLEGYGWQEETLTEILDHLDADDWAFVQTTWDTIEELWPGIAAMEKRMTGVAPPKIEAREFTNDYGTWRGGYFPVIYDPLHSAAGEKQVDAKGDRLFESTYVRATTEKGHTKARVEAAAYPILLSLEVVPQHMVQVIHDLAHREAVVTANRLLNHPEIRVILNSTIGAPYYRMLKQWLATVANDRNIDRTGNEFWTRFMGNLRTNATIVGMGFRMTTMFAQVTGFSQSLDIVKGRYLSAAMLRALRHPVESAEWVAAKSGQMRHRRNSLDRDIRDGVRKLLGKRGAKHWIQAKAFAGIGFFDALVSVPTWIGAYDQARAEGLGEPDSIAFADRAVRLSQGAGGAKDLAAVQRSNDFMKLFTMFYSYFSVLYNRLRNMGRLKHIDEITWIDVAWKSFVMVMVPAIMGELITGRGPDDDDDKAAWAIRKILAYPFMTIPFLRDIVNSTESGRPYSLTPVSRLFEMTAKLPSQVEAVAEDRKDFDDLAFQFFDLPGYAFGLPTGQARTTTKYLWDLMEGDLQAEDMGDVLKGLAFGQRKGGGK